MGLFRVLSFLAFLGAVNSTITHTRRLSSAIEIMTQRDEGADKPSTCYNLLEQHWTQVMDFRTVGMIATGMIVDFPKGAGLRPGPHVHCGLSETFVAIKDETGPGSMAEAFWMFEEGGAMTEHPVEDGDVLLAPLGRVHTYYTRTPGAADNKEEIPSVVPELWSRHLVIKIQGHNHQLRAESTGPIYGNCMPRVNNVGSDLSANGGRQFTGNFDKGDPGFIIRSASLNPPPQPQFAPPNYLAIDSEVDISDDTSACDGLVGATGSKPMISADQVEDAYSLTKCYMEHRQGYAAPSLPDVGDAVFLFVRRGTLSVSTGVGKKSAKDLDGITVPANTGSYAASCVSYTGCEVWKFVIDTKLNIALSPHFGVDASRKVRVTQSDYGRANYDSYQTCRGEYEGNVYEGGVEVDEEIAIDWATGQPL